MDWLAAIGLFASGAVYGWAWHRIGRVNWRGVKYDPTEWELIPLHEAVQGKIRTEGQPRGVLKSKGPGLPKVRTPVLGSRYGLNELVKGSPFECDHCHGIGHIERPNFTLRCSACGSQQAHPL